ncbi:MAG: hypothetical protein JW955_07065 [Sedimentisphaerales bacterium]|nr:hypothetical protein [Sedimentisphaerales bacterium]
MCDPRKAAAQYNDYRGEAAADMADGLTLGDLAKQLDIDKRFWPVGFDLYIGETYSPPERPEVFVSVYAVDSNEYGSGIEAVNRKVSSTDGLLRVERFSKKIPAQQLFTFFKRFHVTGFNKTLRADRVDVAQSAWCGESQ